VLLGGTDARDWIRGTRPWDQFLTYCRTVAQYSGSRLRAAQLADDRYLAEIELLLEDQARRPHKVRPSAENFTPEVEAIYMLGDDIRLLIQAMTKSTIGFHERPETPADRIKERNHQIGRRKLAELIGQEVG